MKRGATITDLASEFLARMSGSAGEGSSVVVVPTPTDPAGIRRCARDLKTWSAAKKHTNEERGGSRDNEYVGFFALLSSGHGPLLGYTW